MRECRQSRFPARKRARLSRANPITKRSRVGGAGTADGVIRNARHAPSRIPQPTIWPRSLMSKASFSESHPAATTLGRDERSTKALPSIRNARRPSKFASITHARPTICPASLMASPKEGAPRNVPRSAIVPPSQTVTWGRRSVPLAHPTAFPGAFRESERGARGLQRGRIDGLRSSTMRSWGTVPGDRGRGRMSHRDKQARPQTAAAERRGLLVVRRIRSAAARRERCCFCQALRGPNLNTVGMRLGPSPASAVGHA